MPRCVDVHVGRRIRQRRWILNLTQKQVAERLGVHLQQLQHYETGANRVSASKLWAIASVLEVPIDYFFADLDEPANETSTIPGELLDNRETLMLVRAYCAIPTSQRRHLLNLARVLGTFNSSADDVAPKVA